MIRGKDDVLVGGAGFATAPAWAGRPLAGEAAGPGLPAPSERRAT